jgi:hypothetical protein
MGVHVANDSNNSSGEEPSQLGTRRGALATLLGGSALGLAAIGLPTAGHATKKAKRRRNQKQRRNGSNVGEGDSPQPTIRYVYHDQEATNGGIFEGFAECPSGYIPIGWGVDSAFSSQQIMTSVPQPEENRWSVQVNGAVQGDRFTVIAVCLQTANFAIITNDAEPRERKRGRSRDGSKRDRRKRKH